MAHISKSARSHRKHTDDRELYQGKRRLVEDAEFAEAMNNLHTTHGDDCGCLTEKHEKEIAALRDAVVNADAKIADRDAEIAKRDALLKLATELIGVEWSWDCELMADYCRTCDKNKDQGHDPDCKRIKFFRELEEMK